MGEKLTEVFMELFCEKNSDGSKNLVMRGKDLWQRINTRIEADDMVKVAAFLRKHPEILSVDLSYNNIHDKGFLTLINDFLNEDNNLLDLNLMMCDITEKSVADFVNLPKIALRSLRLNGNQIGFDGGKNLALMLTYTDTILHLDIGETNQTLSSIAYFMKVLHKGYNACSLRVLDLSRVIPNCNHYPYDTAHLAESIGAMLEANESLIEIHLQKNQFDAHDIELMLVGIGANRTLLMLDLGYNKIGDYGIELIGRYLKRRPPVLGLNVAGNGITDVGARALSFTMPYSRIRLLDISFNKITDIGMLDILHSIRKPVLMRMLCIWGNVITHETNKIIRRMLYSKVLEQRYLDVKIYEVDKVCYAAYYPSDRYKHLYYCVMDYACPIELKIRRNFLVIDEDKPRPLINFRHYPRIPPVEHKISYKK